MDSDEARDEREQVLRELRAATDSLNEAIQAQDAFIADRHRELVRLMADIIMSHAARQRPRKDEPE